MPFGIQPTRRLTLHLRGDAPVVVERASDNLIATVQRALGDDNAVITLNPTPTRRILLPVRSIIKVEDDQEPDTSNATVELYQDPAGELYLRDPDEILARAYPNAYDRPGMFAADARALIHGQHAWNDDHRPRHLTNLTLIATYRMSGERVAIEWRPDTSDPEPRAATLGRRYIGEEYIDSQRWALLAA
ncbi:hypothetical protein ACQSSU_20280 [Micromonospora echinospora]